MRRSLTIKQPAKTKPFSLPFNGGISNQSFEVINKLELDIWFYGELPNRTDFNQLNAFLGSFMTCMCLLLALVVFFAAPSPTSN